MSAVVFGIQLFSGLVGILDEYLAQFYGTDSDEKDVVYLKALISQNPVILSTIIQCTLPKFNDTIEQKFEEIKEEQKKEMDETEGYYDEVLNKITENGENECKEIEEDNEKKMEEMRKELVDKQMEMEKNIEKLRKVYEKEKKWNKKMELYSICRLVWQSVLCCAQFTLIQRMELEKDPGRDCERLRRKIKENNEKLKILDDKLKWSCEEYLRPTGISSFEEWIPIQDIVQKMMNTSFADIYLSQQIINGSKLKEDIDKVNKLITNTDPPVMNVTVRSLMEQQVNGNINLNIEE